MKPSLLPATMPRHLERVDWSPNPTHPPDTTAWPFTVPAIAQLIAEGGLDIASGVTFLVGGNGSGKSTLVEALAATYPRGGHATSAARVMVRSFTGDRIGPLAGPSRAGLAQTLLRGPTS